MLSWCTCISQMWHDHRDFETNKNDRLPLYVLRSPPFGQLDSYHAHFVSLMLISCFSFPCVKNRASHDFSGLKREKRVTQCGKLSFSLVPREFQWRHNDINASMLAIWDALFLSLIIFILFETYEHDRFQTAFPMELPLEHCQKNYIYFRIKWPTD